ncbi:cytochrome P450 [Skermanella stibiiresistens SB22]|uniref:Cytochrome P450 n=1 Tax=Skermanella stibiiresistens SB22 TaxID=1385369 RepID=W9GYA3_9PROT|nr:cytochrome P450 [Skermanella stibiiresistens]EWY38910.1 cytochrome P450 [Skermanella stibiiresistens SB22]
MPGIPRDKSPDTTLALLREGYPFITNRCRQLGSDAFVTRMMLRRVVCMRGEEAARVFYHPGRFTRNGAIPRTTFALLQDKGSVASLDGEAHRVRKRMFLSLMKPEAVREMGDALERAWRATLPAWSRMDRVVVRDEIGGVLCRAACDWAGVPLTEAEAVERTREFRAMIGGAGSVGPRAWRGRVLRARTEGWARAQVEAVRDGSLAVRDGSALEVIAWHRDDGGELLPVKVAAVELLNILRPIVAVDRFITFAALALHQHPETAREAAGDDRYLEMFTQEVRRFYPFFPVIGGRVLEPFEWRGHRFAERDWVLLDLYGTNHEKRVWGDPDRFRPERFVIWDGSAFNFIPQGGGDFETGHRCPGEWITIELVKRAVRMLVNGMGYVVPRQDLTVSLSDMPTGPASGFVIQRVEAVAA